MNAKVLGPKYRSKGEGKVLTYHEYHANAGSFMHLLS